MAYLGEEREKRKKGEKLDLKRFETVVTLVYSVQPHVEVSGGIFRNELAPSFRLISLKISTAIGFQQIYLFENPLKAATIGVNNKM